MTYDYNLLVDSPSELSPEFVATYKLHVLNFRYSEGVESDVIGVDDMFQSTTPSAFYDAMRAGAAPLTTQPSQLQYEEVFSELIKTRKPTLYLCFDSAISGAYESAMTVLERLQEKEGGNVPITIVDTKLASTPLNILCHDAALLRAEGMSLEDLSAWATRAHYYMYTYFMIDDLHILARGGRIPKSAATVGSALNIKPILTIKLDGSLGVVDFARGRKKGLKKLADTYASLHDAENPEVGIGNADCEEDAKKLLDIILSQSDSKPEVLYSHIGPVIGCHVGPNMISCCFWGARHEDE